MDRLWYPSTSGVTPQPTQTAQSIPSISASISIPPPLDTIIETISTTTFRSRSRQTPTTSLSPQTPTASPTQLDATASAMQESPTTSSTQLVLIIFLYHRCRRRRKTENSAGDLPTHNSVPEPTLDDDPVTDERGGFLARLKRPRPTSIAKTTIELTSSPSTTHPEELPSPSFPSERNSVLPGFAELPISSVSDLSSADRGVYSSTNVSTVSTGAAVPPHDTLRGGGRPVMMPNMVSGGRKGKGHTLSWQRLEPRDRY